MGKTIYWNDSMEPTRKAVLELCYFVTNKGLLSSTGRRLLKQNWQEMTPAARNILTRAGIKERRTNAKIC